MNNQSSVYPVKVQQINKIMTSEKNWMKSSLWTIKSLPIDFVKVKFKGKACDEGKSVLERAIEETERKYKRIKVDFIADMNELINCRNSQIKLVTDILISELNYLKGRLDSLKEDNKNIIKELKSEWNGAISTWQTDVNAIEKETVSKVKDPIGLYIQKLILTRRHCEDIPDILLALILEINHIIIGNSQTVLDTRLHLTLLWENHFKTWKADIIYTNFDETEIRQISEESVVTGEEVFSENIDEILALLLHLRDKQNLQKELKKCLSVTLDFHPILIQLENYREELKSALVGIVNCIDSELCNILLKKKNALEVARSTKSYRNAHSNVRQEDELQSFEILENDLLSLTLATKTLLDESSVCIRTAIDDWNRLVDTNLDNVKNIFSKKLNKYKHDEEVACTTIAISLNIALDNLGSAPSTGSLDDMWSSVQTSYQDLLNAFKQQYERKLQLLDDIKDCNIKCYSLFLAKVRFINANYEKFQGSYKVPEIGKCDTFQSTFILALQNASSWYSGFIRTLNFLRDNIILNRNGLGLDMFLAEIDAHGILTNVKMDEINWKLMEAKRAVYEARVVEIRTNRWELMSHLKAMHYNLEEMKRIEKTFEEQVKALDKEYEQAYKELTAIRDMSGDAAFARTLKLINNVKTKFMSVQTRKAQLGSRLDNLIERRTEWMNNSNAYFLIKLRLLHQGGECGSEEVTKAVLAVNKCSQDIQGENRSLRARVRKALRSKIRNYTSKAEKLIKEIKDITQEEGKRMKIKLRYERVRSEMKREIMCARERITNLDRTLESQKNNRDLESWLYMIEEINKTLFYFNIPSSNVNKDSSEFTSVLSSSKQISFRYKKKPSRRKARRESLSTPKVSQTSKQIARSDNFWEKINVISRLGLTSIKAMMQSVRAKVGDENQDGTQPSSRASPEDFLKLLKSLKAKIEVVWMDMVIDLLCVIYVFKMDFKNLLLGKCGVYKSVCWKVLREIEQSFLTKTRFFEEKCDKFLNNYSDSLKVIHGHPSQKKNMVSKKNEVLCFCKNSVAIYKTNVELYRNRMKTFLDGYTRNCKILRSEMFELISGVQENKAAETCVRKIKQTSRMLATPSREHLHHISVHHLSSNDSKEVTDLNQVMDNEDDDESFDRACKMTSLRDLRLVIEYFSNKIIGEGDPLATQKKRKSPYSNVSETSSEDVAKNAELDYEMFMGRLRKELVDYCRRMTATAITGYEAFGVRVQKWYKQWDFSVTEIEKLYAPYFFYFCLISLL